MKGRQSGSGRLFARPCLKHSDTLVDITVDVICVILLIVYFLHFALQSLPAHFRADDLRNMAGHWSRGPWNVIRSNLCFWSSVGRPLGALYYLPLHAFFDLDPRPYRIVTIALVGATIPVAYLLGRSLTGSRLVAFLAAFAWCYHPQLANLVFINAFIYDVLCSLFYLAALACYVGIRERGRSLRSLQLVAFFALYICALNSKEMAVTLPVIVLIYELLRYYHEPERESFLRWVCRDAAPALAGGVIAAIYFYEKMYGSAGIYLHQGFEGYTPHYSWHAFTTSNAKFISQLFFTFPHHFITRGGFSAGVIVILAAWASVFSYAVLRRDRMLQLMAFWVVITPLPLAFVFPRGGACLIIVLFGWAMIFAKLISDLALLITRLPLLRKVAVFPVRAGVTVVVAILLGAYVEQQNPRVALRWLRVGEKESHVIEAFHALNLHPKPGSKILLTDSPFAGVLRETRWAPLHIANLVWDDHSLTVYVEGKDRLNAEEVAKMDYILAVHEYKVDVIREPL